MRYKDIGSMLSVVVLCLTIISCGKTPKQGQNGEQRSGPATISEDWIGFGLGLQIPMQEPRGRINQDADIKVAKSRDIRVLRESRPGATQSNEPTMRIPLDSSSINIASVNVSTGEMFVQSWDSETANRILRAVSNEGLPRSLDISRTLEPANEPETRRPSWLASVTPVLGNGFIKTIAQPYNEQIFRPTSWSDGEPSFVRLGIEDGYGANHRAYRSIGQIGSGCSGTLIGPRHVLTAAHCIVDRENQTVYSNVSFRRRRDWSEGTAAPTEAYGSREFIWYYFPLQYWDGTVCNDASSCNQYDIAIGILDSEMPVPEMGYWYAPIQTLNTWTKYNRGYPRCFDDEPDTEAPRPDPPCHRSTLFGDARTCQIGDWRAVGPDGYNRELYVNCDGARGMSGSPMYRYHDSGNPVTLGVYSQFICTAEACANSSTGDFPNIYTRITPESAGWIASSMSIWSCSSGFC